jgi:hypothetical protein
MSVYMSLCQPWGLETIADPLPGCNWPPVFGLSRLSAPNRKKALPKVAFAVTLGNILFRSTRDTHPSPPSPSPGISLHLPPL